MLTTSRVMARTFSIVAHWVMITGLWLAAIIVIRPNVSLTDGVLFVWIIGVVTMILVGIIGVTTMHLHLRSVREEEDEAHVTKLRGLREALAKGTVHRPIDAETGEPMSDEDAEKLRRALSEGRMIIPPHILEELEEHGITEDEIRAAMLRSVKGMN